jgi:hypothetical protein
MDLTAQLQNLSVSIDIGRDENDVMTAPINLGSLRIRERTGQDESLGAMLPSLFVEVIT